MQTVVVRPTSFKKERSSTDCPRKLYISVSYSAYPSSSGHEVKSPVRISWKFEELVSLKLLSYLLTYIYFKPTI